MKLGMSTRRPQKPGDKTSFSGCTEFHLHKSQNSQTGKNVHDFSFHRLNKCIQETDDPKQREVLETLLKDYRSGRIALAWREGKPIWLGVTKST
jgi:hypothetical protein